MTTMMVFWMTLVITIANVGIGPDFLSRWGRAFAVAYFVALPLTYYLGPLTRQLTARIVKLE